MLLFIIALITTVFGIEIGLQSVNISSYNINKYLHPEHFKDSFIIRDYKRTIEKRVNRIMKENPNKLKVPHKMDEKLKEEFPYSFRGKVLVYIINSDGGEILSSNNGGKVCVTYVNL